MASTYLPQPSVAAAQARSNQQALALGCDGITSVYWWPVQPLTDGTATLVITPGTAQDVVTSTKKVLNVGLTAQEQSTIQTRAQLGTKLSSIVTLAAFMALLTPAELLAIGLNATTAPGLTAIQQGTTVDLQDPSTTAFVNAVSAAGIITQAAVVAILSATTPITQTGTTASVNLVAP
jgi:hypothetical protein